MKMLKHTGYVINTNKKCAILFLELPEKPGYCLIAETETLPERIHDPLMNIINSPEAQNAQNLAEVLSRRLMPDTNNTILVEMHNLGYLRAEKASNIMVVPRNNIKILASELIESLKKINENPFLTDKEEIIESTKNIIFDKNKKVDEQTSKIDMARNLIIQAELMEKDAENLRKKAYSLAPELMKNSKKNKKQVAEEKNDETIE